MLTLVNPNRLRPAVAPLGLGYVGQATRRAGYEVELLDLGLAAAPDAELERYFRSRRPRLVGIGVRNVDDCFWPSATSFVPELVALVARLRTLTEAPILLGGVGFSVFARALVEQTGADFGVRGDGERALSALAAALAGGGAGELGAVPGLLYRYGGELLENAPAWEAPVTVPTERDFVDELAYFRAGGQAGLETKRGCPRECSYCADPLAKGPRLRLREPAEIADEVASLVGRGIDVLHLCDGEFNLPYGHARAVCDALIRRGLASRVRWYAYAAVTPFDDALAAAMRRAGCVGINFTGDAADAGMLRIYGQRHSPDELTATVRACRAHGLTCMVDLLLGGPGETLASLARTVTHLKRAGPDAVGASLGLRLYPGTPLADGLVARGALAQDPGLRRRYEGPVDLLRPTFYVSPALGPRPASLVQELIAGDERFFPPVEAASDGHGGGDHNYNDHEPLVAAIAAGARGAYWDILRQLRQSAH